LSGLEGTYAVALTAPGDLQQLGDAAGNAHLAAGPDDTQPSAPVLLLHPAFEKSERVRPKLVAVHLASKGHAVAGRLQPVQALNAKSA
jgi:hypothetical protein